MRKAWHILRRATVLLLAAVWFQATAHTLVCHSDSSSCEHAGAETLCSCVCHAAFEPADEVPFVVDQPETVLVPVADMATPGVLLPSDIFRPPLTSL